VQAAARTRAEWQCTSVAIGLTLAVRRATSTWLLFSSCAGRLVERARCAGGCDHRLAHTDQLRPAGYARTSRAAEHTASVERASRRRLLHHSCWTGGATSQQQREFTRRRSPHQPGWCAGGSAGVRRNRPASSAPGTGAHP